MSYSLRQKRTMLIQSEWNKGYYSDLIGSKAVRVGVDIDPDFDYMVWPYIEFENMKTGEVFKVTVSQDEEGNGPGFLFGLAMFSLGKETIDAYNSMDEEEIDRLLEMNGVKANGR